MRREWFLLVVVNACTRAPTADEVCAHYQQLDDAAPMLRVGGAPPHPSSKVASCTRQLNHLQSVDQAQFTQVSRCVMKATSSVDAWDCWVGSQVSPHDAAGTASYLACTQACNKASSDCHTRCADGKIEALDVCSSSCVDTDDQCATACAFP